jgi:hypothetical protein
MKQCKELINGKHMNISKMEKPSESGITTFEQAVKASGIKMCTNVMESHHCLQCWRETQTSHDL